MAEKTDISWCDGTWNPWWGCAKVSPACDHCYAERDSKRFAAGQVLWGVDAARREFGDKHWNEPLRWNRRPFFECSACGARGGDKAVGYQRVCKSCGSAEIKPARMRVFCASMADVFDKNAPLGARERLWKLIEATPNLDWLLLTKRIGNVPRMASWTTWPNNVWLGITVINQEEVDRDVPKLFEIPARVRFLSIEPQLEPVKLHAALWKCCGNPVPGHPGDGWMQPPDPPTCCQELEPVDRLSWVIVGGESGPHARDFDIAWPRSIVRECKAAGLPVMVKQMGAKPVWSDTDEDSEPPHWGRITFIDKSGAVPAEWPEDLRVQEFPNG